MLERPGYGRDDVGCGDSGYLWLRGLPIRFDPLTDRDLRRRGPLQRSLDVGDDPRGIREEIPRQRRVADSATQAIDAQVDLERAAIDPMSCASRSSRRRREEGLADP